MDELNPTVREQEIYEEMELTPETVSYTHLSLRKYLLVFLFSYCATFSGLLVLHGHDLAVRAELHKMCIRDRTAKALLATTMRPFCPQFVIFRLEKNAMAKTKAEEKALNLD